MDSKHSPPFCKDCSEMKRGVFCRLHLDEIERLETVKTFKNYKRGDKFFEPEDPVSGLFCIESGRVKISRKSDDGKDVIVRVLKEGDLFGHRSLFSLQSYGASAAALEDCRVCFIEKSFFSRLIDHSPALALETMTRLSKDLGDAEVRLTSLVRGNMRERFSTLLLFLEKNFGSDNKKGRSLGIRLTREEMASMIGAAQENIIRLVTEFKKEGLIIVDGREIYLTDLNRIREYSGGNNVKNT